ncbi:MAG: CDP-diacylglycerol--glycerol-3-phosphate 3-phosphatidyltransferase [Calditrichia bacterium]
MRFTIPNQLTILRIILTPIFLVYFLKGTAQDQLIASIIFVVASITDWYDGWFARRFGVITRWGQFMDPLADKFLVSSALIVFAWMKYVKWWMVWIIVIRDVLLTIMRIYALRQGTPIITHVVAKWKTFAQMATILWILVYINWLNYFVENNPPYRARYFDVVGIPMMIVTFLTIISAVYYIKENPQLIVRFFKGIFTAPFRR